MNRAFSARAGVLALSLASATGCSDAARSARPLVNALTAEPLAAEAAPAPPAAPRDAMPPVIRGIYVSAYAAGNPRHRERLLALTDSTELNTWVVDVKDEDGVRYPSQVPEARAAAHERSIPIADLAALVDTLQAHGIHPIARIVTFKDPRLARLRPELAIRNQAGGVWRDRQRLPWVSPWDRRVWEVNLDVAEEAVRAGFREVQFDYVRFPEAYRSLGPQVHPAATGDRADAITAFLEAARARLHPLGAVVTADVFGLSMNDPGDVGIGQQWERLSGTVDHLLPMVYPSHYFPTHLPGIARPNRMPGETIARSVGMGVARNQRLERDGTRPARIIPWLQAFTATWNDPGYRYGPAQAEAQIRAVHALGLEDWIFWNPSSKYDAVEGAFARETRPRAASLREELEVVVP